MDNFNANFNEIQGRVMNTSVRYLKKNMSFNKNYVTIDYLKKKL